METTQQAQLRETAQALRAEADKLDLTYVAPDGQQRRPVMIHRAPFGSLERFVGVLIEQEGRLDKAIMPTATSDRAEARGFWRPGGGGDVGNPQDRRRALWTAPLSSSSPLTGGPYGAEDPPCPRVWAQVAAAAG